MNQQIHSRTHVDNIFFTAIAWNSVYLNNIILNKIINIVITEDKLRFVLSPSPSTIFFILNYH
mgnify:CR=1 FL=1